MLDIKLIRENPEKIKKGIKSRNINPKIIDEILKLDGEWRKAKISWENLQAKKNNASKEIQKGKDKKKIIGQMKKIDKESDCLKKEIQALELKLEKILFEIPNLPAPDVKIGKDESENEIIKTIGETAKFDFKFLDYMEIGKKLDLIDTETASKVSGSRFGYLKNQAVLLEFALVRFAFDTLMKEGFIPVIPPQIIKEEMMQGLGYLGGQGEAETYHFEKDKQYFIGTAEHALIPMHAGEIFKENDLPKRYVGFSTCFRREAGSYGKDTKGIFRVHQFEKVEMVSFAKPEDGDKEHDFLFLQAEKLIQALKIPYRIVKMCTGDLAYPSARTYDIECWIPSENRYREIGSISTCTDYQARRLKIKYRNDKRQATSYVHTLNGTAFAIGRTLIAILENYQQKDGSVKVPEVLQKYCGFAEIKR